MSKYLKVGGIRHCTAAFRFFRARSTGDFHEKKRRLSAPSPGHDPVFDETGPRCQPGAEDRSTGLPRQDTFILLLTLRPPMDIALRDRFTRLWNEYFDGEELPITFFWGDGSTAAEKVPPPAGWRCMICDLGRVRKGVSRSFDEESLSCSGAMYYLGYTTERRPEFRYFLSSGRPGVVEGERYKRTPEIVDAMEQYRGQIPAEGRSCTFKRWDQLTQEDTPELVIFFARPEVISGLFTLANFDQADPYGGVICPFGSGCSSIVYYPLLERQKENPKAVLGMFDPSARPCVATDILTMAFPMEKFVPLVGYMEESFLTTGSWEKVRKKIRRSSAIHAR